MWGRFRYEPVRMETTNKQSNRRYQTSPAVCNPLPFATDNRLVQRLQSSVCFKSNSRLVGCYGTCFPPKLPPLPFRGSSRPRNTLFLGQAHSSSQTTSRSVFSGYLLGQTDRKRDRQTCLSQYFAITESTYIARNRASIEQKRLILSD